VGILGYVIAAAVQALAQSHRRMVGSLVLVVEGRSGRMVGLKRSHFGGRVGRSGHIDRVVGIVVVVVLVIDDRRAGFARSHRLVRGFVRVNLFGSPLAAHAAFRMALDCCVDCDTVQLLRGVHSRSLGCDRIRLQAIREIEPALDSFGVPRPCQSSTHLTRYHCGLTGPSPYPPSSVALALVLRPQHACLAHLPNSASQGAHPRSQVYSGFRTSQIAVGPAQEQD
jgi:hypothetical protein